MNAANILVASLNPERITVQQDIGSSKRLLESMAKLLTKGLPEDTREKDAFRPRCYWREHTRTPKDDRVAAHYCRWYWAGSSQYPQGKEPLWMRHRARKKRNGKTMSHPTVKASLRLLMLQRFKRFYPQEKRVASDTGNEPVRRGIFHPNMQKKTSVNPPVKK